MPFLIDTLNLSLTCFLQTLQLKSIEDLQGPKPEVACMFGDRKRAGACQSPSRSTLHLRDLGRRMSKTHMDEIQRPRRDRHFVAGKMRELEEEYRNYTRISGYSRGPEILMALERLRSKSHS